MGGSVGRGDSGNGRRDRPVGVPYMFLILLLFTSQNPAQSERDIHRIERPLSDGDTTNGREK